MFTNSRFFQCFHLLATVFALVARGVDTPDSSSFRRRVFISATVLGDYVYFDGGEISEIVDNIQPDPSHASYWDMYIALRSISLKLDWTNDTVSLKATAKTNAPVFNFPGLWPDIGSSNFYMWSGSMAYAGQGRVPPANQLWKFTADGNGGGVWASVKSGNSVAFSQLVRPDNCAFCVINNVGYCVGGSVDSGSDPSIPSDVSYALPGVVGYDISSQTWENSSSVGFGGFGTLLAGRSAYVPFGPKGLMLLLGGSQSPVGNTSLAEPNDFVNLTLWDPTTKRWYSQETTGSRPIPKSNFCVVGAQGLNGTYEIFIYGGVTYDDTTSDQVYVLSLPGFVFFLAPATATKRAQHACILAGKRQMLSIGGDPATMPYLESLLTPDPWIQGLGVLDLPTISWTSSYNSNAGEYDSPEVVKGWYSDGGLATASWSSDTVKQLFKNMSDLNLPTAPSSGPSSTPSSGADSASQSTPVSAIMGGVVGGVLGLALIAGVFVLLCWRRNKKEYRLRCQTTAELPNTQIHMKDGEPVYVPELANSGLDFKPSLSAGQLKGWEKLSHQSPVAELS